MASSEFTCEVRQDLERSCQYVWYVTGLDRIGDTVIAQSLQSPHLKKSGRVTSCLSSACSYATMLIDFLVPLDHLDTTCRDVESTPKRGLLEERDDLLIEVDQ